MSESYIGLAPSYGVFEVQRIASGRRPARCEVKVPGNAIAGGSVGLTTRRGDLR